MANGGITGAQNTPTHLVASGTWGTNELLYFMQQNQWPVGTFTTEVGSFQKMAGAGTQDVSTTIDLSQAVAGTWALIIWSAGSQSTAGTWSSHIVPAHIGFTTNYGGTIQQYAAMASSRDAVATSAAIRRNSNKAVSVRDWNGGQHEADFTQWNTGGGFRLTWGADSTGTAAYFNYMIVSGLEAAKAVAWTMPSGAGNKSVTGVEFRPDLVMHGTNTLVTMPDSGNYAMFGWGAMNKHGQQWANSWVTENGTGTPFNTSRYQQTDACLATTTINDVVSAQAHFVSMDADGFSMYFSTTPSTYYAISLCLKGLSSKLGAFTHPTSFPSTKSVPTSHGFTVKGSLFSSVGGAPLASPTSNAIWEMSGYDSTNKRHVALVDAEGVSPTNADSIWTNDRLFGRGSVTGGAQAFAYNGDVSSIDTDSIETSFTTTDGGGTEHLYMLMGAAGTDTFPAKVYSHNAVTNDSTAYSNQKKAVELSTGRKVVVTKDANWGEFWYSDDGQGTNGFWNYYSGAGINGWSNGSIDAYVDSGGTERLVAVWKQSGTGGGRVSEYQYVMVGTFSADRTTLTWGTPIAYVNLTHAGWGPHDYPDVVAHPHGSGGMVHIVYSAHHSSHNYVFYDRLSVSSATLTHLVQGSGIGGSYSVANTPTWPSMSIDPSTNRLFAVWSAGTTGAGKGIRFRSSAFGGGTAWFWDAEVEVDPNKYVFDSNRAVICRWDAGRSLVVIGGYLFGASHHTVVYDSSNFTTFTARIDQETATWATNANKPSMAIDAATGDVYLFSTMPNGSTMTGVRYRKFTRTGALLSIGDPVFTDHFFGEGVHPNAFQITGGIGWVYTSGNNAPYAVKYDRLEL